MTAIPVSVGHRGPDRSPRRILALTLLALVGVSARSSGQTGSVLLSVELPDNPAAGTRLFAQKHCARCHTLGGKEARVGPDLGRIREPGSMLDLAGAFWNHAPVMRTKMQELKIQPPTFTSHEMANLAAFLTAYRYYLTALGDPGNPTAGREVFAAKGCAGCHADDAARGRLGPNLARYRGRSAGIFLAQAMWNHGPEMAVAMRGRGVPWPKFSGRQMGDLVAYLQADNPGQPDEHVYFEPGNPRRGREIFSTKRCDACHAIGGSGGNAPDLNTRGLLASAPQIAGLMWNHSQGMTAEFERRGITQIKFADREMADVIAYLYFVNYANVRGTPARGAQQFREKCSACHSMGGGDRVGPDLATAPQLNAPIAIIAAMWNHAPRMEQELQQRGLAWPRFQPGDAADLAAFLLARRTAARSARTVER